MTLVVVRHLVAMSQSATWHLDFILMSYVARRSELAHLGKSLPVSIHGSWPSFVSQVVAFIVICGWSSSFFGQSWQSWVVVGIGCCVMVAVGGIVGLW